MKKLMEAIKGMALNYVLNILKEKEDELAKDIASKFNIPGVPESKEIDLVKGVLSATSDVLKELANKK